MHKRLPKEVLTLIDFYLVFFSIGKRCNGRYAIDIDAYLHSPGPGCAMRMRVRLCFNVFGLSFRIYLFPKLSLYHEVRCYFRSHLC